MNNFRCIKIIVITFFVIFLSTQSKSEIKIAVVEMDVLMKKSLAGKSLIEQLKKFDSKNKIFFNEEKKKLALEKDKISAQKNILSKEEYEKKVISLNKKYTNFQKKAEEKLQSLKSKRDVAMKKILKEVTIVLSEYSSKNELTFIIDQKNIIIGKTELNVTNKVLKLVDSRIKKVSLK